MSIMEKAIVFDVQGEYALFKKPYSPLSPVSFPVPPPTAIFGMVGAIAGFGKDEYLERMNDGDVKVGIRLLKPIRRYRAGLNVLTTKNSKYFRPDKKGPRTQVPFEFIVNPAYRIYFVHSSSIVREPLLQQLKSGKTVYTPCLGVAQCIADVEYVGSFPVEKIAQRGKHSLNCVIPLTTTGADVHYATGRKFMRFSVPARMGLDRTVTHYEDIVVDEDACEEGVSVTVKGFERIGSDEILLF
mgnify:CR=1 FL=1